MATTTPMNSITQDDNLKTKIQDAAGAIGDKAKDTIHTVTDRAKDAASNIGDRARDAAHTVADKTRDAAHTVADKTRDAVSNFGGKAEDATHSVGKGMESLAGTLRDKLPQQGVLGTASSAVASGLESGGRYLEEEGLKGMADDMTNLIRRNPIPAVLVGVALGFLIARVTTRS